MMMRSKVAAMFILAALTLNACNTTSGPGGSGTGQPGQQGDQREGAVAASCVENYSPDNLKKREFAFDGELVRLEGESGTDPEKDTDSKGGSAKVVFKVIEWFKGGDAATVAVEPSVPSDGSASSADSPPLEEGERYLVSGDDGIMHACGFTVSWTEEEAAEWKASLKVS